MSPVKTDADRVDDANEIIRQKNAEILSLKRDKKDLEADRDELQHLLDTIEQLASHDITPPEWISGRGGKIGMRGAPITCWSDFHYGERVSKDQTNGRNEYNKHIARKRLYRLFDTTVDLAYNHMGRAKQEYPGIIVCLGGDLISGNIHEELAQTNDRTDHQAVDDLTDILAAGIDKMASSFGKVFLPCVVGNHGRSTKKLPMKNRVISNYDWSIYRNLKREFKKSKHVKFMIPTAADAHFQVYGTRYLLTHGDSLGVKGGDGIIGAIGPIMRGSIKLRNSEMQIGDDFDIAVMGHWHQMLWLPNVIVNNSVKGYDEYAMLGLRAPYSRPSQGLWFDHPEHGITARWEVFLEGKKRAAAASQWVAWPHQE
jgi:predicted phosphodiesterase